MNEWTTVELNRINYLNNEIDVAYHEAARKLHLSDSALLVLYTICNHGDGCLLQDICRLSGTSKQTINSALRKLEAEGIVYLETFDGRKKKVYLTEKGRQTTENTVLRLITIENEIIHSWSEDEQQIYLELTQRYLASFREKIREL